MPPEVGITSRVLAREQHLVAEDGEIGRSDVQKQPFGITSGDRQLAGPGTRRVGGPEADVAARVFADEYRLAGEHGQIRRADVEEKPAGKTACDG